MKNWIYFLVMAIMVACNFGGNNSSSPPFVSLVEFQTSNQTLMSMTQRAHEFTNEKIKVLGDVDVTTSYVDLDTETDLSAWFGCYQEIMSCTGLYQGDLFTFLSTYHPRFEEDKASLRSELMSWLENPQMQSAPMRTRLLLEEAKVAWDKPDM